MDALFNKLWKFVKVLAMIIAIAWGAIFLLGLLVFLGFMLYTLYMGYKEHGGI